VCRTEHKIGDELKRKIAQFCNLKISAVIEALDASSIYEVPLLLRREQLDNVVLEKLYINIDKEPDLENWRNFLRRLRNPADEVTVGLIGKYAELPDAYKSILEAFIHASAANEIQVRVQILHSEDLNEENISRMLHHLQGILVAPGFGKRGIEGKIQAVRYARESKKPFLGLCLGMQIACIEFARHILGLAGANSTEFDPHTPHPVIELMESQEEITQLGGTMRLGAYTCQLKPGTLAHKIYGQDKVRERHRHRYEFNSKYSDLFEQGGIRLSGINPETQLIEIIELPQHPFFIATQFHPEYRSTVENPHRLFTAFVQAMLQYKLQRPPVAKVIL
jgi:CTP synthase